MDLLAIVDFLTAMWPCDREQSYYEWWLVNNCCTVQRRYYAEIRTELLECCLLAGVRVPAAIPIPGLPMNLNATMIPSFSIAKESSASDIFMAPLD